MFKRFVIFILIVQLSFAVYPSEQNLSSPAVQKLLAAPEYSYPLLRGIRFDSEDATRMEFIVDSAGEFTVDNEEVNKLTAYFLAGLTVPEKYFWVNLSPYEQERVIPESLQDTDLGHTMLKTDYVLKQMAAAFLYPGSDSGKNYWQNLYAQAGKDLQGRNIPINAFNKIWIVPKIAKVYENDGVAYILKAELEVLTENDYLATKVNRKTTDQQATLAQENMRKYIIPRINRAVNESEEFAPLRQIYYALILSTWFKHKLKDSCYGAYIDKNKTAGLILADKSFKQKIYNQYADLFKNGLYDYVQRDRYEGKITKRRYVCGGLGMDKISGTTSIVRAALPEEAQSMGTPHLIPVTALTRRATTSSLAESLINRQDLNTADTLVKTINEVLGYTDSTQGTITTYNRLLTTIVNIFEEYTPDLNNDGRIKSGEARKLFDEAHEAGFIWDNANLGRLQELARLTPTVSNPNEELVTDPTAGLSDAQLAILVQNGWDRTFQLQLTRNCPNQCSHCGSSAERGPMRHMRFSPAVKAIKRAAKLMDKLGLSKAEIFTYGDNEPTAWRDPAINATIADIYAQVKAVGFTEMPVSSHGMDGKLAGETQHIMSRLIEKSTGSRGRRVSLHVMHSDVIKFARAKAEGKIGDNTERERKLVEHYADRFFSLLGPLIENEGAVCEIAIELPGHMSAIVRPNSRFGSVLSWIRERVSDPFWGGVKKYFDWAMPKTFNDVDEYWSVKRAEDVLYIASGKKGQVTDSILDKVWARTCEKIKAAYPNAPGVNFFGNQKHLPLNDYEFRRRLVIRRVPISWTGNGAQTLHDLGASENAIRRIQDRFGDVLGDIGIHSEGYSLRLLGDRTLRLECLEGYRLRFRTPQEMGDVTKENFTKFLQVLRQLARGELGKDFIHEKQYFEDVVRTLYFAGEDLNALLDNQTSENIAQLQRRLQGIPFPHKLWEKVVGKGDPRFQRDVFHVVRNYDLPQTDYQEQHAQNIGEASLGQSSLSAEPATGEALASSRASVTQAAVAAADTAEPLGGIDITADRLKVITTGNIFKLKNFHTFFNYNLSGLDIQPESSWDLFDYEMRDMLHIQ